MYDSGLFGYIDMQKIANIGSSAFEGCSSFAYDYIMFAPYLTSVGDKAFKGVGSATSVTNYSSATFGSDVFADSTVTVFNNLGGSEITQNNVGSGITINNGYSASTFFGMISGKIPKDGIVYELILLIPMFVIVGMVLAIAVECMISRRV